MDKYIKRKEKIYFSSLKRKSEKYFNQKLKIIMPIKS